jgi:hypothetical protein
MPRFQAFHTWLPSCCPCGTKVNRGWLLRSVADIAVLFRRALYRAVGTENAAVTWLGSKQGMTARALVKELAGVDWHSLALRKTADRTN